MSTAVETNGLPARRAIGVLVIDPTPLYREGLAALIARTPGLRLLGATGNAAAAVALSERAKPDVVVVDSVLDPRSHLSQLLLGGDSRLAVLAVVREPLRTAGYVASALGAGTHGVVPRSAEPARMVEAIRRTCTQRRYLDPELAALGAAPVAAGNGGPAPLSRREYQVLQLISHGLENQEIAKQLFVSVETIRTHVKGILRKLSARDRAHAVAVAYRLGVLAADQVGEPTRTRPPRRAAGPTGSTAPAVPINSAASRNPAAGRAASVAPSTVARATSRTNTCRGYQAVI
ncbi:MAG TPA: response regulator transcription factor [Pseudonocardiaceae bacterium]|nr:response regulator transcription factor [Pseudonocardiaceae bacterium]